MSLAKRSAMRCALVGVVELGERVVLLHEAQLLVHHLLGEPLVAVDVDLDGERQPGLEADVDQAELTVEEVVVEDPLLAGPADELRPFRPGHECERRTGFQGTEDAHESLGDALVSDEVVGPLVLAELAGAIRVGAAGLLRPVLGMRDQAIGVLGCQGLHEVATADLQDAVDEVLEFAGGGQGQMALEDDAVEAGEHGDDEAGKLGDEARQRLHGVLLREGLV